MSTTTPTPNLKLASIFFAGGAVCYATVAVSLLVTSKSPLTMVLFAAGATLQSVASLVCLRRSKM